MQEIAPTTLEDLQRQYKDLANDLALQCQVLMDGDINAEIAIVGEGPGNQEVNQGIAFIGESGNLMWNALRKQHILRTDCYSTNVCKRQVSIAANPKCPVTPDEWLKWRQLIQWELRQLPHLRYIFCMGNAGIGALLGFEGITKFRGSYYEYEIDDKRKAQVICAFNPAYVIREPTWEIVFHLDCQRFAKVVQGGFVPHTITKHINPTFAEACDWIDHMVSTTAPVAYDIETISRETACHGLACSAHEAMCINLRRRYEDQFTIEQEATILLKMQDLFDKKEVITQNGNFDAHWVGYKDLLHCRNGFDTLLAHHTLYPLLPHSLAFLTAQYTTHPFYKDDIDEYKEGGDIDAFWQYNCTDAAITWECARKLSRELKDQKLWDFFNDHVMRLDPHLVRSTVDGIPVDMQVKGKIAAAMGHDVILKVERFHKRLQQIFDLPYYKPNLNSNQQMRDLFINRLKCQSTTGSVDKAFREKAKEDVRTSMEARELLIMYDEYQREQKFFSTYAEMRIDPDDRFRTTWKQQGVVSAPGRLSSAGNLWGTATNAQNQPERSHEFFLSDKGTVYIYIDGAQAEARVVTYTADIERWKEDFERARLTGTFDAHRSLASSMYKIAYDDTPSEDWEIDPKSGLKVPTIRYKAKRCRHGLNYRMSWMKLAETAKLSLYEAKKSYILYHNDTPEIRKWWDQLGFWAKKERELWTPLGRRLKLMQRLDEKALESIVAFVPQSTIGDLLKRVWYQASEDDRWDNSRMRIKLNNHDALIGFATPAVAKTALHIIKEHLEKPIMVQDVYRKKAPEPCIIPGDCKISEADEQGYHRWSTLKKVKLAA